MRWKRSILQIELLPLRSELVGDQVDKLFRRFALRLGGALHFGAVLIGAGGQHDIVALHPLDARDGFGRNGRVGVPDVRAPRSRSRSEW